MKYNIHTTEFKIYIRFKNYKNKYWHIFDGALKRNG